MSRAFPLSIWNLVTFLRIISDLCRPGFVLFWSSSWLKKNNTKSRDSFILSPSNLVSRYSPDPSRHHSQETSRAQCYENHCELGLAVISQQRAMVHAQINWRGTSWDVTSGLIRVIQCVERFRGLDFRDYKISWYFRDYKIS